MVTKEEDRLRNKGAALKKIQEGLENRRPTVPLSSQDRKYGTKGSEYKPGATIKPPVGVEVPAIEESLYEDLPDDIV